MRLSKQVAMGPTTTGNKTRVESDEIRELKALVDELQAQVQYAERLTALAANWIVASPGATVQRHNAETQRRGAGWLKARRARHRADRLAATARRAIADANAAEAAAEMRDRATELTAVRRKVQTRARAQAKLIKKASATTTTRKEEQQQRQWIHQWRRGGRR